MSTSHGPDSGAAFTFDAHGKSQTVPFAPGVDLTRHPFSNDYRGTQAALVAAGMARPDEFPGQPGRGKVMATYGPDGEPLKKGLNRGRCRYAVGYRQIRQSAGARFVVIAGIGQAEVDRRSGLFSAARDAAVVRRNDSFIAGQMAKINDYAENHGRVVRLVDRVVDRGRFGESAECAEMPLWRVKPVREPLASQSGPKSEAFYYPAGLIRIDYLRVVLGGKCDGAQRGAA